MHIVAGGIKLNNFENEEETRSKCKTILDKKKKRNG